MILSRQGGGLKQPLAYRFERLIVTGMNGMSRYAALPQMTL